MIAWAEAPYDPAGNVMRALFTRWVSCSGAMGPPQVVSWSTWWEPGNIALAHSPTSQNFLVVWQTPAHTIPASLVDLNGAPWGPTVALSTSLGRDPSATWNPNTNLYGVAYSGETYSAFALVPPWNAAAFGRNTFNATAALTTMTDLVYNPFTKLYVMTWFEILSGSAAHARVAELDANGNIVTSGVASARLGSYDALSLALNPGTGTFLLVGVDRTVDTATRSGTQHSRISFQRREHAVKHAAGVLHARRRAIPLRRHGTSSSVRVTRLLQPDRHFVLG